MGCHGRNPRSYYQQFESLPHGSGEFKWLYAIGFTDGITKIGCTKSPRQRITAHAHFKAGNALIAWFHIGRCVVAEQAPSAEREAIDMARSVSKKTPRGREWFINLSKSDAIRFVCEDQLAKKRKQEA